MWESFKKGIIYHLTRETSIYEVDGKKRVWFNNLCQDTTQDDILGVEKEKKVEKLWKSPFNELLWKNRFEETYQFCENCHANIFWDDRYSFKVISKDMCLCSECVDLPHLSSYIL